MPLVVQAGRWSAVATVALMPVPALLGISAPGEYLAVSLVPLVLAAYFCWFEDPAARRVFLSLLALGWIVRFVPLVIVYVSGVSAGGPFLGPDSTSYYRDSLALAALGFETSGHPFTFVGTNNVAHYYAFAALVRLVGADLFELQLFNCGLTALVGPVTYAWARRVLPIRHALTLGVVVTLFPSLIALSVTDLLKDPSVVFFTTVAVWSLVLLTTARSTTELAAAWFGGVAAFVWLMLSRFYVAAYLEMGVLAAGIWLLVRGQRRLLPARALVAMLLLFVAAELVVTTAGYQSSTSQLAMAVNHTLGTPAMRDYEAGLVERLADRASDASAPPVARPVEPEIERPGPPGVTPVPVASPDGAALLRWMALPANMFRRLYGPFLWVLPEEWSARHLLTADYLLYPGGLVWYIVLPFVVFGLAAVAWRTLVRPELHPILLVLLIFSALYLAQYLIINLSYRQRETMFPVLALFALLGFETVRQLPHWRRAYLLYWTGLVVIALTHVTIRAVR